MRQMPPKVSALENTVPNKRQGDEEAEVKIEENRASVAVTNKRSAAVKTDVVTRKQLHPKMEK